MISQITAASGRPARRVRSSGGLGVAGAAQHAVRHGAERKHMAGADERIGMGGGIGEQADGVGAVRGGDAGGDAVGGIHADGEGGFVAFEIAAGHLWKIEFLGACGGERRADQAAAVDGHEIDHFRGAERGGADEVGLVFAGWIIGADDHSAGGDFRDDFIDGAEQDLRWTWTWIEVAVCGDKIEGMIRLSSRSGSSGASARMRWSGESAAEQG